MDSDMFCASAKSGLLPVDKAALWELHYSVPRHAASRVSFENSPTYKVEGYDDHEESIWAISCTEMMQPLALSTGTTNVPPVGHRTGALLVGHLWYLDRIWILSTVMHAAWGQGQCYDDAYEWGKKAL